METIEGYFNSFKLPELPEDVEVRRGNGLCICKTCGLDLYHHPQYRYQGLSYGPHKGCDGEFYHL